MILYAAEKGEHGERYLPFEETLRPHFEGKCSIYVNLTNRCTCACTFCLRSFKKMAEESSLWLKEEPSVSDVKKELDAAPWQYIEEVVFCGFGEPTMRIDDLVELLRYVKKTHPDVKTRINTNGLSDLNFDRDTAKDFEGGILDSVSISLNASNAERYLALTKNRFGLESYEAMLAFAGHMKAYVPDVVMTVVDHVEDEGEIERCKKICEERGLRLRVRPYQTS